MKRLIEAARAGETTLLDQGLRRLRRRPQGLRHARRDRAPDRAGRRERRSRSRCAPRRCAKLARWPVTLSYFNAGRGEQTPVYVISFELYENGVSRALKLDYGEFALKGESTQLRPVGSPRSGLSALSGIGATARRGHAGPPPSPNFSRSRSTAASRFASRTTSGSARSPRSASAASHRSDAPMPISRKAVPSHSARSSRRDALEQPAGELRRRQARARCGCAAGTARP